MCVGDLYTQSNGGELPSSHDGEGKGGGLPSGLKCPSPSGEA